MASMTPCPHCGDDRPNKLRVTCSECGVVSCIWCNRDAHAIGVHWTGRTLHWRDSDYWKAVG